MVFIREKLTRKTRLEGEEENRKPEFQRSEPDWQLLTGKITTGDEKGSESF